MKKIIFLFLYFSNFGFSQNNLSGSARYNLSINGNVEISGSESCGTFRGLQYISTLKQYTGINNHFGVYDTAGQNYYNLPINYNNIYYTDDNPITTLYIGTVNRRNGGNCGVFWHKGSVPITTCLNRVFNFYEFQYSDDRDRQIPGSVQLISRPEVSLINPTPISNLIGSDDFVNVSPIAGISNQYYNWEFSTNAGLTWASLPPQYQNRNYLNVLGRDINPSLIHKSPLSIRINSGCNGSVSNPLNFFYRISAPHIVGTPARTPVSCYSDTNDGSATFTFADASAPARTAISEADGHSQPHQAPMSSVRVRLIVFSKVAT